MSRRSDNPPSKSGRGTRNAKVQPALIWRLWRLAVEHPRGVLIAAATLLGLIVVLGNWRPTRAKLLVWEPELPFIVWALIFMLVGYLTGKWIEWALMQRKIRKGTYKPRVTAEDLADTTAALDESLPAADSEPDDDPATIIDRSGSVAKPEATSDSPVEKMDYWDETGPNTKDAGSDRFDARDLPDRSRSRGGGYTPAPERSGPAPSRHRSDRGADGGRYGDYADYQDGGGKRGGGRYGDYNDYADYQDGGSRRSGGRRR